MVNQKGWLRIVEASIAILIIFSVLLIINGRNKFTQEDDLARLITPILEEIARNSSLREKIINDGSSTQAELFTFIGKRIKQSTIKYDVIVCSVEEICSLPVYPKDAASIYASERVLSSTLDSFNPKKVKIFLWRVE